MQYLAINPAILVATVSNGYIAFHAITQHIHQLNPVAALLLELCDGVRSKAEVFEFVRDAVGAQRGAENLLQHWLDQAIAADLLHERNVASSYPMPPSKELNGPELARLAARLRETGWIDVAFQCQARASQLLPGDAEVCRHHGELAYMLGFHEQARDAYTQCLLINPDDAELKHLLDSLDTAETRDLTTLHERVPSDYIRQLYSRFSTFYETNMVDELGYEGPQRLLEVILKSIGPRRQLIVLDLGCGTGLAGKLVRPLASRLVGVDLSPEMIDIAQSSGLYDELHVAEVCDWIRSSRESFDLIIACDTLIYMGDLQQIIEPAAASLEPYGNIAFSVELGHGQGSPYRLSDSGRYVHTLEHIKQTASNNNLQLTRHSNAFLRMEYGNKVRGLFVSLSKS